MFWAKHFLKRDVRMLRSKDSLPNWLLIALTSRCNLSCKHCKPSKAAYAAKDLPRSIVEYVCDNILPHMKYVRIGGNAFGEQLLAEHFDYFLQRLRLYALKEKRSLQISPVKMNKKRGRYVNKDEHTMLRKCDQELPVSGTGYYAKQLIYSGMNAIRERLQ